MTDNDAPALSPSDISSCDFNIDCLYQDVYYEFQREFGITCSLDGFNKYIDKENFKDSILDVIIKKDTLNSADILPHVLGLVIPGVGQITELTENPAGKGQAMFNIATALFPQTAGTAKFYADMFNLDIAVGMEDLADKIGQQMKTISIPGTNIFNRGGRSSGGGGRTNDEGELETSGKAYNGYMHHEPVKNSLNWNLDIDNTMLGTLPIWESGSERTCFIGKFNMIQFPNDDVALREYYEYTFLPVLRNAMQANKRYTADLSVFFTYDMFKQYINEVIQSIAIYYFFANGYAYCNEPGLVNNNAALRHLRQELFATAQLQRFQQLGQLLDSLPIPQTLINAVAQYHGWYSNSPEPGASLYCNIPHGVFKDNSLQITSSGVTCIIDRLQENVIVNEIIKLNAPIVDTQNPAVDARNTQKFLGLLLNTIPGWRNSSVSGSFFATDLYDEAHWNEFMNSPTVHTVTMFTNQSNVTAKYADHYPQYTNNINTERYFSVGSDVPGYLQAYWTPIAFTDSGNDDVTHHGIIKSQPREISWNLPTTGTGCACRTWSNVIVWKDEGLMLTTDGNLVGKGFTLYPTKLTERFGSNIASPVVWKFDNGLRTDRVDYPDVLATADGSFQQPACTYNTINMSLNQCLPNRLIAIQKLLDVQDFFTITSPTAIREKTGRRGRKSNAKSKSSEPREGEIEKE